MTCFVIFEGPPPARIKRTGFCHADTLAFQLQAGETLLETDSLYRDDEQYVAAGPVLASRVALPPLAPLYVPADGTTPVMASGLPNPTHVTLSGAGADAFDVTDGTLEMTFSTQGRYIVTLDAGAIYKTLRVIIDAT